MNVDFPSHHISCSLILLTCLNLTSCGSNEKTTLVSGDQSTGQQNESPDTDMELPENVTYYKDIQPIIHEACIVCHLEGGRSFEFETPTYATLWSELIARDVADGGKPPPTADPECADYVGSDWHLSDRDIAMFARWHDQGSPEGNISDASSIPMQTTTAPYSTELRMPVGYIPPETERYMCSAHELNNVTKASLTGFEFITDDINLIHHALLYVADGDWEATTDEAFDCNYGGIREWRLIGGWRPGSPPVQFPSGKGIELLENTKLVMSIYYFPEKPPEYHPTAYWGLHIDESKAGEIYPFRVELTNFLIPAEETQHQESGQIPWQNARSTIHGSIFRSHQLSTGMSLQLERSSEEECVGHYDFYDALTPHALMLKNPVTIDTNDKLRLSCEWDNSSISPKQLEFPPVDIQAGYDNRNSICQTILFIEPQ